ncbi:hypothetical protein vseg_013559 [Gypsophila vaccaria]
MNFLKKHTTTLIKNPQISPKFPPISRVRVSHLLQQIAPFSQLKVQWRKDLHLDNAIQCDKKWRICSKVVKEVLIEPNQVIPLRYLEKRRNKLKLNVEITTFINQNPLLFDVFYDRVKPKSELVKFVRPSENLRRLLEDERRVYAENEMFIVEKLCRLLMMARDHVISLEKLAHVKREFGFPSDFIDGIVRKYPNYFRVVREEFLELVTWEEKFAKSVIMRRAEEEERMTGIRVRPSFDWKLPRGFFIKKEMREWVRDWVEMPYISPYEDVTGLDPSSREMEKRMVGVLHELLSLSLMKRVAVPIIGKFSEDYRLSNAFASAFTRHSGIFYVSLKGGIKTAVLREAYRDGVLIDRDPLLEIKDRFVELLEEGWKLRMEELRLRREAVKNDMEEMVAEISDTEHQDSDEQV